MDSQSPFEGVSNRAHWQGGLLFQDDTDDALIDFTGSTATMTLRSRTRAETIIASTEDGRLTFPEPGYVAFLIPATAMREIADGTYDVGVLIERDGAVIQGVLANLPIIEGL